MRKSNASTKHPPRTLSVLLLAIASLAAGCNEGKAKVPITLPKDEATFINIVTSAKADAESAQNDMQIGGVKAKRDRTLCDSDLSYVVNNWVGKLERLDSNSDGKGVLSVSIAPDILVKTWNNEFSDLMDRTLIEPGTPVFDTASALSAGQYVVFSGHLFRGLDGDCVKEASLTLKGKVMAPEFIFRFDSIAKYAPSVAKPAAIAQEPLPASPKTTSPTADASSLPAATVQAPEPTVAPAQQERAAVPPAPPQPAASSNASSETKGPSFDCKKASSIIEQLVCKDETLARLDIELAEAYKVAAKQAPNRAELKSEQLDWLKNQRNKCVTAECVVNAYEHRVAELRN